MGNDNAFQSVISLLLFGAVLLLLGGLLGANGWAVMSLICLALGGFFCAAGLSVRKHSL